MMSGMAAVYICGNQGEKPGICESKEWIHGNRKEEEKLKQGNLTGFEV